MIKFKIASRIVGDEFPPLVISEIGINHNGSLDLAITLADAAISAGAEIIKHQTHVVDDEMSEEAKKVIPGNAKISIYEIIKKCALTEEEEKLFCNHIKSKKKIFISTPFSKKAVDRCIRLKVPAFKIGSGECNNYHLVEYIAKFKLPIIMSTGMNSICSIRKSVNIINKKKIPLALLHCTNIYPTPSNLVRLDCIKEIKSAYPNCLVGISDHTENIYTSLAAVSLGARIIEKHFTDDKKRKGPDISSSMDSNELRMLIEGSKLIFEARGGGKAPLKQEKKTIAFALPSVVAEEFLKIGDTLTKKNIALKRPGGGDFGIGDLVNLYGRKVVKEIQKNTQINKNSLGK
jgi:N-acetylneuraminate synthase